MRSRLLPLFITISAIGCAGEIETAPEPTTPTPDAGPMPDAMPPGPSTAKTREPPEPVMPVVDGRDGQYRGPVSWVSSTCSEDTDEVKARADSAVVDVMPMIDGSLTLTTTFGTLIQDKFPGIAPDTNGKFQNIGKPTSSSGVPYDQIIDGTLTPATLSFSLESNLPGRNGPCVRKFLYAGERRKFSDVSGLDGHWRVESTLYKTFCKGDPADKKPDWQGTLTLDAFPAGGQGATVLTFGYGPFISVRMPIPTDGTLTNVQGTAELINFSAPTPMEAIASGSLQASAVNLTIDTGFSLAEAQCAKRVVAIGKRRLPSPTAVENFYHISATAADGCNASLGGASEWSVDAVVQSDGKVSIIRRNKITHVFTPVGDTFIEDDGSEKEGEIFHTEATIGGGVLRYTTVDRYRTKAGEWCAYTFKAVGRARYTEAP